MACAARALPVATPALHPIRAATVISRLLRMVLSSELVATSSVPKLVSAVVIASKNSAKVVSKCERVDAAAPREAFAADRIDNVLRHSCRGQLSSEILQVCIDSSGRQVRRRPPNLCQQLFA